MLKGSYELSDAISESLKNLITSILKFDPEERLPIKKMLSSEWVTNMQDVINDCTDHLEEGTPSQLHAMLGKI